MHVCLGAVREVDTGQKVEILSPPSLPYSPTTSQPIKEKRTLKNTRNSSVSAAPLVSVLIMAMERRVWLKRRDAAAATRVAGRAVEGRKKPIVDWSKRVEAMATKIPRWNIVGVCGGRVGGGVGRVWWVGGNEKCEVDLWREAGGRPHELLHDFSCPARDPQDWP